MSLSDISFFYGYKPILNHITATFHRGQRYIVKAPNGTGKSTLLQIMSGLKVPASGQVLIDTEPLSTKARGLIGFVSQNPMLFSDLTAEENLRLYAKLYGLSPPNATIETWLDDVGLKRFATDRVRTFSKGMRQRLSIARALLHDPIYILLDEPYDGLDDASRQRCSETLFMRVEKQSSIVMVTHHAEDIVTSDIVFTLQHGSLVPA